MTEREFSEIVRKKIDERGVKHAFIAEKMGMSRALLSSKLNHTSKWSVDQVSKISKILDIPPDIWVQ